VRNKLYYQFTTQIAEGRTYVRRATTSHVHIPEAEDMGDNIIPLKPKSLEPGNASKELLYTCHWFNPKGLRLSEQTFLDENKIAEKEIDYDYDLELPREERQTKPFSKTTKWEYDDQKFGDLSREEITAGGVTRPLPMNTTRATTM